jgi:large repetitive protein
VPTLADGNQSFTAQIRDAVGNDGPMSSTFSFVVDTIGPAAPIITDDFAGTVTNAPVVFTIAFEEPVSGFTFSDLVISGGTGSGFTQTGSGTFTVVVTPLTNTAGTMTVTVPAGAATDAAGNPSLGPASGSQGFDTVVPTQTVVAIVGNDDFAPVLGAFEDGKATNDSTPRLDFTLSTPLAAGQSLQVFMNGTIVGSTATAAPAGAPANTYSFTPTTTLADGRYDVTARVVDADGNPGPTSDAFAFVVDTVRPLPVITDDIPGNSPAGGPVTFTFTFNEPVFDFTADDVSVVGGTPGAFGAAPGSSSYTLIVDPLPGTGDIVVTVLEGAATDAAGNLSLGPATATQRYNVATLSTDDVLMSESGTTELRLASISTSESDADSGSTSADPTYAQSGFSDSPLLIESTLDRSIA